MTTRTLLLCGAALGAVVSLAAPAGAWADTKARAHHRGAHAAAPAGPTQADILQQQVKALQDEVSALKSWRDEEMAHRAEADQQAADLRRQLAAADAEAQAAKAAVDEQIKTIPGAVKTEIAAEKPKDGKIHYKGVSLTLGGFAAAETVNRSRNELADIGSSYAKIPFANSALAHVGEMRFTARQSRLSMLAEGDINESTHAAFYTELDFLAGAQTGNSNESNSFSPRIRNVYGTLDLDRWGLHILAGQSWSLATLNTKGITPRNEAPPPTIDAQYVAGFTWARQPQVRVTADFDDRQVWAALSVENPQTTFAGAATGVAGTSVPGLTVTDNGAPTSQFDSANTLSLNHAPDVVGKLAFEPDMFGGRPLHLEVYGLYRNLYDRVNVTNAANVLGLPLGASNRNSDGGGVGWGVSWTVVPNLLDVMTSGLTGRGVGRYGSGQLADSVVGPNGGLKAIPETMLMAGATGHLTRALDLYVYAGQEREKAAYSTIGATVYGFGAPTATLAGCSTEGASCSPNIRLMRQITTGVWDKVYQGRFGQVRVGLQYSYTQLDAFAGATGGAPTTNDHMIFTSIRYYPF